MPLQPCAEPMSCQIPGGLAATTANSALIQQEKILSTVGSVRSIGLRAVCSAAAVGIPMVAAILLTACASSPAEDRQSPVSTATVEAAPTGGELFAANCAACHGPSGEGQPDWHIKKADGTLPPPPLNGDGHTWHHGDGLLYRIVSQGGIFLEDPRDTGFKSAMPAFGDRLSHDEISRSSHLPKEPVGRQGQTGRADPGVTGVC